MFEQHQPFYRFPMNLQLFAGEGGEGGAAGGAGGGEGGQGGGTGEGAGGEGNQDNDPPDNLDPKVKAYFEKMIQSETDKIRTKYTQEKQNLEKELNGLKRKHMTEQERLDHERQEKERVLQERERELTRKSLELVATTELATAGLPVEFRDLVVGVDEKDTKNRIQTVKTLLDKRVEEEVTNRLKAGGRIPAGAGQKGTKPNGDAANSLMNDFIRQAAGRN